MTDDSRQRLEELARGRLGPLLVRLSWPALVSMTLNALYSVVDRVYIGHGCGADAIAGIALTFPIMMALGAFGPLIGLGHGALISIRLGQGDRVGAERALGECVALKIALFAVLPPLVFVFLERILRLTGGASITPAALAQAVSYMKIVVWSHVFSHLAFGLSSCMRSEGAARQSMQCMVVGFGANLVLDPVFIFGLGMGVKGAAWATVIAMACSCAWAFWFYLSGRSVVRMRLARIRVYPAMAARALAIGLGPFLQQFAGSAIGFSLNMAFAFYTPERSTVQIASAGVFHAVVMMLVMPILGVQQGLAPIIGFNWGARSYARVRRVTLLGLGAVTLLTSAGCALNVFAPGILARAFVGSDAPELLATVSRTLRLANSMLWCISLNIVATTYFQSIGRPRTAIVLSLLRQVACLIPLIWLLPLVMADPVRAVWMAMPVSDVLACVATIPPFAAHMRYLASIRPRAGLRQRGGKCA